MILFATPSGLSWVSGAGGVPSKLSEVTETSGFYRHPTFLPDGRSFLYDGGAGQEAGIYLGSLDQKADSKARRRIIAEISNAQYLPPSEGLGAGRLLADQLYGVKSYDALVLGGATVILLVCACAAAIGPAVKASSIDPARTLRAE